MYKISFCLIGLSFLVMLSCEKDSASVPEEEKNSHRLVRITETNNGVEAYKTELTYNNEKVATRSYSYRYTNSLQETIHVEEVTNYNYDGSTITATTCINEGIGHMRFRP